MTGSAPRAARVTGSAPRAPRVTGVCVVLAAGGTAGHLEPALALADALRRAEPDVAVTVLGTPRGLETRLVPARGYRLVTIPAVPLPRRPGRQLLTVGPRLARAYRAARRVLSAAHADVLVGFGSYAALPAYLAARRAGIPSVVHESNALPGLGNRVGARLTGHVHAAVPGTGLPHAVVTGIPLRRSVSTVDRAAARAGARESFGLDGAPGRQSGDRPTLLVTGGSQGAASINRAAAGAADRLAGLGFGMLHVTGPTAAGLAGAGEPPPGVVRVGYTNRMDLAYAAADLVLSRSGAMTCAELSAVGLPAVFVPLPHGNGEQGRNAAPLVAAGAALVIPDAELTADRVVELAGGLLADQARLAAMSAAGRDSGHAGADDRLAAEVLRIARDGDRATGRPRRPGRGRLGGRGRTA